MADKSLIRIAYQTLQQGKSIAGLAHKQLSTKLMELLVPAAMPEVDPTSPDLLNELRHSMASLEKLDWEEAEQGIYPKSQLFDSPWFDWATRYPLVWLDLPSTWARRKDRKTRDIPSNINEKVYPDYYLQNFHHQTDGYFSDHSAQLYDIQVEILFNGTADSMRRRILAPLRRGLKRFNERPYSDLKILDVATGTGRALKQIRGALPKVQLLGIDLSSAYLRKASHYLNNSGGDFVQLVRGNAENMPFENESIHAISCVFLLHELPPNARQNVLNECWRVLKPGGIIVLADSIQPADSPQFSKVLEDFHKVFHEPYYKHYLTDDIDTRLINSKFESVTSQSHFMTRIWVANKPIR